MQNIEYHNWAKRNCSCWACGPPPKDTFIPNINLYMGSLKPETPTVSRSVVGAVVSLVRTSTNPCCSASKRMSSFRSKRYEALGRYSGTRLGPTPQNSESWKKVSNSCGCVASFLGYPPILKNGTFEPSLEAQGAQSCCNQGGAYGKYPPQRWQRQDSIIAIEEASTCLGQLQSGRDIQCWI